MNRIIEPASAFSDHQPAWDALNAESLRSPVLDSRFVGPLLQEFGAPDDILVTHQGASGPVAMGILTKQSWGRWSTLQPSQAPLGLWLSLPGVDLATELASLRTELPGACLLLSVTQQDPALVPRPHDTPTLRTLNYIDTARITRQGDFETYWRSRGKNLRHNMKRQRNRLTREGTQTRLECITASEQILAAVRDYGALESAGWKSETGTSISIDNAQGRFYSAMLSAFARTGEARVYRYFYDDRLVATDLCILGYGSIIILKTTYDESETTTSPALLMRQDAFRTILDEGQIDRIEFYGKVMEWHTKWSDEIRTLYHINHYRSPAFSLVHRLRKT